MIKRPDVDIDFPDREQALALFQHVAACQTQDGRQQKHKTGVYFHPVPIDPFTGFCDVDFRAAEELGFFKVDLLNVGLYKSIQSREHLRRLAEQEPLWDLLEDSDFVGMLFHVANHADILQKMKPKSLEQLAAVLAMIRPAKRHLVGLPWDRVLAEVWVRPEGDEYFFKKSHSFSYALAIVVQMNLLCEQISYSHS